MRAALATAIWEALGTTALVRVDRVAALTAARSIVEDELDQIDAAASRFRPDSELHRVNGAAGSPTTVSLLLYEAIEVALGAAAQSDGAVDPTLGEAIRRAGYARDFKELTPAPAGARSEVDAAPGPLPATDHRDAWRRVVLQDRPPRVTIPAGVSLDLGATAKALAADRAALRVAAATGAGALVSLGGDIAVAGPSPPGGWTIHVTDDHRSSPDAPGQTIVIASGGLATSSVTTRRWLRDGRVMHHILDPRTGSPAGGRWRTATVAATSCVEANTASTAAIVLGESAVPWLRGRGLHARLVSVDGAVTTVGGWPSDA